MKHVVIDNEKECCGCSACSAVCPKQCITLKPDALGFVYPEVDESLCVDCGLCRKVCSVLHPFEELASTTCFAAANTNADELRRSSSGGIFIALARNTIKAGGVVFGAVFNDDWSVSHRSAETMEEVLPMMTSKYLQSRMENCYSEARSYLKEEREVLFTGTPCQVAGLKHFLRKDYPNLLAVEVICHGAPSPAVWQSYLVETFVRPQAGQNLQNSVSSSIHSINFRNKQLGWLKYGFFLSLSPLTSAHRGEGNTVFSSPKHFYEPFVQNPYMQAFLRNWSLRPSCYDCQSKGGRSHADITIGDFWGIERLKDYPNDDCGTSCVVCRTSRGESAIMQLTEVKLTEVVYSDILYGNPSMERSVCEPPQAQKFRKLFPPQGFSETMRKVSHVPFLSRVKRRLWRILSALVKKNFGFIL